MSEKPPNQNQGKNKLQIVISNQFIIYEAIKRIAVKQEKCCKQLNDKIDKLPNNPNNNNNGGKNPNPSPKPPTPSGEEDNNETNTKEIMILPPVSPPLAFGKDDRKDPPDKPRKLPNMYPPNDPYYTKRPAIGPYNPSNIIPKPKKKGEESEYESAEETNQDE